MFIFLRSIGLKPIEWSYALDLTGKSAPFVGEILDAAFSHAQAVVVLFTGDDIATLKAEFQTDNDLDYEKEPTPQARPNVLFEAGMAFGSHPDRTVIVELGVLRPFSDIAGRHVIRMDNSVAKRQELAQRLIATKCSVDLTGTDWHQAGDFEKAISMLSVQSTSEPGLPTLKDLHQSLVRFAVHPDLLQISIPGKTGVHSGSVPGFATANLRMEWKETIQALCKILAKDILYYRFGDEYDLVDLATGEVIKIPTDIPKGLTLMDTGIRTGVILELIKTK
jgi:hypothetical protein